MRRKEKEITDIKVIEDLIARAHICRIGLSDEGQPYIVPMNFGYQDGCLYLHSAKEGRKIEILRQNNRVCFEIDLDYEYLTAETACNTSAHYRSVIGFGRAMFVEGNEAKIQALDIIMNHYEKERKHTYSNHAIDKVAVIKVELQEITAKQAV